MYSARITRLNPTAFIFLIDQSGSMAEKTQFGNSMTTKAEAVAIVTNMLIRELISRCQKEEGVMDYFDIAAIGYSHDRAKMILGTESNFAKPSVLSLAERKQREITRERVLPDGTSTVIVDKLRYWIEPEAEGSTPMYSALEMALRLTTAWCRRGTNRDSYPPTIFNITDGEATDSDYEGLVELADQIKMQSTEDGKTLLININISGVSDDAIIFPSSIDELPRSRYTDLLYDMSSEMPVEYNKSIEKIKQGPPPYRGMGLNSSVTDLIAMMDIGSRSFNGML